MEPWSGESGVEQYRAGEEETKLEEEKNNSELKRLLMCWFAATETLSNINSNHQVNTFTAQNIFVSRNANDNSSHYTSLACLIIPVFQPVRIYPT